MKVRASISLSAETMHAVDLLAKEVGSRSRVIETAILEFLAARRRRARDQRDRKILDRAAAELNAEMEDVLAYQISL